MPDPGDLRERVTIQREVSVDHGGGGSEISWSDLVAVWAQVLPVRGGEQIQAMALEAQTLFNVTIRWRSDVTEQQRLRRASGAVLNIRNVVDPDGRRQWLRLTAEKGVAT